MKWYLYGINPIDYNWSYGFTDVEFGQRLVMASSELDHELDELTAMARLKLLVERAGELAAEHLAWRGDYSEGPVFFAIPQSAEFAYGFAWKQDKSGACYVCANTRLEHLNDDYFNEVVEFDYPDLTDERGEET